MIVLQYKNKFIHNHQHALKCYIIFSSISSFKVITFEFDILLVN